LKRGSLGSGMEATFRSVVHGSTDLPAVLTMGALGPVFRLTRAATFARLAGAETVTMFTRGVGLRAAAYLSGRGRDLGLHRLQRNRRRRLGKRPGLESIVFR
jgi:hypothetical protein